MDPRLFKSLVAEASLAPSVHNIQPTRWRAEDGCVIVTADPARRLPIGDPEGRDVAVSHGCAVEGFSLAAAARGLSVKVAPGEVATLTLTTGAESDSLRAFAPARRTYRGRFETGTAAKDACAGLAAPDLIILQDPSAIAAIAALYDDASLRWFRRADYRAELVSWMRLSRRDPNWGHDGLDAESMAMSPFEAAVAGLVLRPGVFEALDRLGAARPLVAEASVVRSATALALMHTIKNALDPLNTLNPGRVLQA